MRVLLTDGSGLTSRQVTTLLAAGGHECGVMSPSRLALGTFTRHVACVHRTPAYGTDPEGWLAALLAVLDGGRYDIVLPTQEQVALLAREAGRVPAGLAVPPFASVLRVQDKVAQVRTLGELGLRHPASVVVAAPEELGGAVAALAGDGERRPAVTVYVKAAIGTASTGVWAVRDEATLRQAAAAIDWRDGPVVVQRAAPGPLAMVQAVYARGRLVAHHACVREREGINGGAAVKQSVHVDGLAGDLERLGEALRWHGALSLDAILTADGPSYIDVNPRLVEPMNAARSGVDLVGPLLALSVGEVPAVQPAGRAGVRTHQLLIGVLGAARDGGRRAVARELAAAGRGTGPYASSTEELTPWRGDLRAAIPLAAVTVCGLLAPSAAPQVAGGAAASYALTPAAWSWVRGAA